MWKVLFLCRKPFLEGFSSGLSRSRFRTATLVNQLLCFLDSPVNILGFVIQIGLCILASLAILVNTIEESRQSVIISLSDRVKLMRVALGAAEC